MRRIVAFLPLIITLSSARPQGYDYPQPSTNHFTSGSSLSPHIPSFSNNFPQPDLFPASRPSLITKHIYVHVPPPDPDDHLPQQSLRQPVQPPRRNYKIIFIKAPTAAPAASQQAQLLAQPPAEDKTIIYVLVKKPEDAADLSELASAAAPAPPSKPEVYFIRYKTKKGDNGINGINGLGGNDIGLNGLGGSGLGGGLLEAGSKPDGSYGPPGGIVSNAGY
ncbi:unnamed protein product [Phyllotreta striolata]|uniref:DUF243 domain-containing protein n=1 Tax=Phyllotreta striolata TaxID=444603 RepID=A0A9N9TG47_PHYSR|nr:unnamed protein product [Phyllotreta striolata]